MSTFGEGVDPYLDALPHIVAGDRRQIIDAHLATTLELERQEAVLGQLDTMWGGTMLEKTLGDLSVEIGGEVNTDYSYPAYSDGAFIFGTYVPRPIRLGGRYRDVRIALKPEQSSEFDAIRGGIVMSRKLHIDPKNDSTTSYQESGFFLLLLQPKVRHGEGAPTTKVVYGDTDTVNWENPGSKLALESFLCGKSRDNARDEFVNSLIGRGTIHRRLKRDLEAVGVLRQNETVVLVTPDEVYDDAYDKMAKFFINNRHKGIVEQLRGGRVAREVIENANKLHELTRGVGDVSEFDIAVGLLANINDARKTKTVESNGVVFLPPNETALDIFRLWHNWMPHITQYPEYKTYLESTGSLGKSMVASVFSASRNELEGFYKWLEGQNHGQDKLTLAPELFPFD